MKWLIPVVLLSMLVPQCFAADKTAPEKPAQSLTELRQQLENQAVMFKASLENQERFETFLIN